MGKRNNMIPNGHFHKHWQRWVRTWFNQPARKKRRHNNRVKKGRQIAPRPIAGLLHPVVRCPTRRYNTKTRLGRGFSLDELKAAGINKRAARSIGIAVDHRRKNRSIESLQQNVQRLKEYKSKLILFPHKSKPAKKGEATEDEMKMAKQLEGPLMNVSRLRPRRDKARAITDEERKASVFQMLCMARADQRLYGLRLKKQKEAAEEGGKVPKSA